jgi:TonB family protein
MPAGSLADGPLMYELFDQANAASGANIPKKNMFDVIHVKRNVEARTVDISFDFPAKQTPSPSPTNSNDSRFIGKFQYIPPATASSGTVQNIPPVITSSPSRGLIVVPGQPPPLGIIINPAQPPPSPTNQGVFLNVAPTTPANSRNPNSQNISSPIYRAGQNGITGPLCKFCPKPEYSQEARDANIQGTVYLQVEVLANGSVGETKLTRSLEKSLDEEAIKVVREKWIFTPGTDRDGNPVNVIVPIEVTFQLFAPPQPPPPITGRSAPASPATVPLTSTESVEAKIFTGPVTDSRASTPSYMGLVNTQTIYAPKPELPRLARQANLHEPTVTLNIIVNAEGKVISVEYVKGPAIVVQAAIDAVRNWIIKGTHDGAPVTFQISVEVAFSDK